MVGLVFTAAAGVTIVEQALKTEAKGFGRLSVTPQSKSLMSIFNMVTESKKIDKNGPRPLSISKIGVIGAGVMGYNLACISFCLVFSFASNALSCGLLLFWRFSLCPSFRSQIALLAAQKGYKVSLPAQIETPFLL